MLKSLHTKPLCLVGQSKNPSMILISQLPFTFWLELVLTEDSNTNDVGGSSLWPVQVRAQLRWPLAQNSELWSYFSPILVMRCILVCTAETQRALHVHSIPESPPLWANTASHSLSVTLQHMILTPTAVLISLFMNVVAHKKDISSRGCDCAQRR